jgi:predicted Zn-dependent protease
VKPAVDPRPLALRGLSLADRRALGDELSRLIAEGHPLRDDPAAIRRLDQILEHLAASRSQPREPIQFHVPDSAEVNVFSHTGGHIYVNRGVFTLAQTDAELEFVVAHELAHAELGHTVARVEQLAQQSAAGMGLLPGLHFLIALGYSAEQEFAADAWAYQALRRLGRTHRQSVGFLRRYAGYAESHDLPGHSPPRTRPSDSRQDLDNHYPAHPPTSERLKRLEAQSIPKNPK